MKSFVTRGHLLDFTSYESTPKEMQQCLPHGVILRTEGDNVSEGSYVRNEC